MPNHPNLDKTEAAHGGLPTPPPLTETPQSPLDENTSPDEVVAKCRELQASNASLWSQVVNLQAQNDYWVQVYDLIEKGLAAKVREMDVLVQENTQLKVDTPQRNHLTVGYKRETITTTSGAVYKTEGGKATARRSGRPHRIETDTTPARSSSCKRFGNQSHV